MTSRVGVWIDHRKAVIVTVAGTGEKIEEIESNAEKQPRPYSGLHPRSPYGPQQEPGDDRREMALMGHIRVYLDQVIARLHGAQCIFIFGPGEAKLELKKRLEHLNLGGHIDGVETADKMTSGQIAAKVREYFRVKAENRVPA